jgi:hypothetical protein
MLVAMRRTPNLRAANPVFVDPTSRLWLVPTPEIIVRLRADTDPQAYFGADWPRARRLAGTRDQFVLALATDHAEDMLDEVNRRAADPRVAWAQPNFLGQVRRHFDDPYYRYQWNLNNTGQAGGQPGAHLNAPAAWQVTPGRSEIVIAVLDDGTEIEHPDLVANLFVNPDELGRDEDGNGYRGDYHGWNFVADNNDVRPDDLFDDHGTATAGVAAAAGNNLEGGVGVAFGCQIMPIKIITGQDAASDDALAEAIYYAAGSTRDGRDFWRGADVLSISLSFWDSPALDDALAWAARNGRGGFGCPIFAAAGNDASRWQATRFQLPLGDTLGAGSYRLGFEYRKDSSGAEGEDLIQIDNVALFRGDGLTLVNSPLGPGGRQDFESSVFPPTGWDTYASFLGLPWRAGTERPLAGSGGVRSARSGALSHSSWTELRTPLVTLAGDEILSFSCYTSCEFFDGLYVWVYDASGRVVDWFAEALDLPIASGNPPIYTAVEYPARHPDVMGVGASTDADVRADYSQYGAGLDFLAPSSGGWSDIITTDRLGTNGYAYEDYQPTLSYTFHFGGTSAATPTAAGVGALLLSANPLLTASDVRSLLRNTCAKIGGVTYTNGWHPLYGNGRVNASHALRQATPNLRVGLTQSPQPVEVRTPLLCTVTVTNVGQALAEDMILFADLASNAPLVAASAPYAPHGNTWEIYLGNLAPGRGTSAWFRLVPQTLGWMTNHLEITSYALDFEPADNRVTFATRVRGPDVQPPLVTITVPEDDARLTSAPPLVQGDATDNVGVAFVDYWVVNASGQGPTRRVTNAAADKSFAWSGPLTGLAPGTNAIHTRATDTAGNVSATVVHRFFWVLKDRLRVAVNGQGAISPPWTNQSLTVGKTFTVEATPAAGFLFSNWVARLGVAGSVLFTHASPQLSFLMQSNLVLEAHFVPGPFLAASGRYQGLFYEPTGVEHRSSGAFTLTVRRAGGYSGELQLAGERLALTGRFALDGRATNQLASQGGPVRVEWTLNLDRAPTNDLFGRVIRTDGAWSAVLLGDRAPSSDDGPSPYAGRYTFCIPGADDPLQSGAPGGDSVGTVWVDATGALTLSGTLADNRTFTYAAQVSPLGHWPLYVSLYAGRGSLLGWVLCNTNPPPAASLVSDRLSWIKPATSNPYHPGPFAFATTLAGSGYARRTPLLPLTNAPLLFLGGNLPAPVTNRVTFTASNTVLHHGPRPLAMTLVRSNGTFTGTLTNAGRAWPFRGIVLQAQTNGTGFFLGTNQSGAIRLGG